MNKMATAMQEGEYDADKPQGKVCECLNFVTFCSLLPCSDTYYLITSLDSSSGDKSIHRQGRDD